MLNIYMLAVHKSLLRLFVYERVDTIYRGKGRSLKEERVGSDFSGVFSFTSNRCINFLCSRLINYTMSIFDLDLEARIYQLL